MDGAQSLTANAGSGTVTFGGAVGGAKAPSSISVTGGSIVLGGNVTSNTLTLDSTGAGTALAIATTINTGALSLASGGAITEAGVITATSLTGGAAGAVGLTNNNSIAAIGSFAVTGAGNSFALTNAPDQNLSVSGTLSAAQDVLLNTSGKASITVTSVIGTGRSLAATAGSGGIALNTGDFLSAIVVDLSTSGTLSQVATGKIAATTLQSTGGVTGNAVNLLLGLNNAIANLGTLRRRWHRHLRAGEQCPLNVAGGYLRVGCDGTALSAGAGHSVAGDGRPQCGSRHGPGFT